MPAMAHVRTACLLWEPSPALLYCPVMISHSRPSVLAGAAGVGLVTDMAMRQGSTVEKSQTIVNDVLTLAQATLKDLEVSSALYS